MTAVTVFDAYRTLYDPHGLTLILALCDLV